MSSVQSNSKERLTKVLENEILEQLNVVPLMNSGAILKFYSSQPNNIYLQQQLEFLTGHPVSLIESSQDDLVRLSEEYHEGLDRLGGISEEFAIDLIVDDGEKETIQGLSIDDAADGPVVKLINNVIGTALKKSVSDIHLESHEHSVSVKYRIDGILYPATVDLDIAHHPALVARLKVMAELDIAERRIPQDGRFKLRLGKSKVDFRISIIPGVYGENVVIRILDNALNEAQKGYSDLSTMGYSELQLKSIIRSIKQPHGMVLVAGPTGSGKTTTLYSALSFLNNGEQKIITIEDPVEYQLPGIVQIPVNLKKGLTFAKGLRSILRHDPDKILVGEIRDLETAEIAVQSALTGHLVFSTVHANSAQDVLARLENIGLNIHIALSAINCIVSQRLVRLNCQHCKTGNHLTPNLVKEYNLDGNIEYKSSGCDKCNQTGYAGRKMVCEILEITDELRATVYENQSGIKSRFELIGGDSLKESAFRLFYKGEVCLDEVVRVTLS